MEQPLSLISSGLGLAGGLFGAYKAGQERKKANALLGQQEQQNQSWFNANYYSDALQRADNMALINKQRELLRRSNRTAANTAAITGATPEAQAIAKEQSNRVISDIAGNISAQNQSWKDGIMNRFMDRRDQLQNQRMQIHNQAAQSYDNLFSNGIGVAGAGLLNAFKKKTQ
jgi:hypothetical protein